MSVRHLQRAVLVSLALLIVLGAAAQAATIHYPAEQLPRTEKAPDTSDWNVGNFVRHSDETVKLKELPSGKKALRIGKPGDKQTRRYTIGLKYLWDPTEPGSTFRFTMRYAADYGGQYNSGAGFGAGGPGGGSGVSLANGKMIVHQSTGAVEVTDAVTEALGGQWKPTDLHTYTLEWKVADPGRVPCKVFVDGKLIAEYTGRARPADTTPYNEVTFEYGLGTALVEYVEWEQTLPPDAPDMRRVLVFGGVGFNRLDLTALTKHWPEHQVKFVPIRGFQWRRPSPSLAYYPGPIAVEKADAFYIAGVPASAVGSRLTGMIEKRVRQGATLIVLGGPEGFGKGGYADSPLEKLLPVTSGGPFDVKPMPEPTPLQPTAEAPDAIKSLSWSDKPLVHYYHEVTLKEGAEVILKAGDLPVLMRAALGEGRAYAFTVPAFGPEVGAYWTWRDWPLLLRHLAAAPPPQ